MQEKAALPEEQNRASAERMARTFLAIARYNSWDDFATGEKTSVSQTNKKDGPWNRLRDHTDFHTDTLTDRIAP